MSIISERELADLALMEGGSTPADGIRALRPGGPADLWYYSTHCPRCGQRADESVRWFLLQDYRCRCGTVFDLTDYQRWMFALFKKDYVAFNAISSITYRWKSDSDPEEHCD